MRQIGSKSNRKRWPWLGFFILFVVILFVSVFATGWLESVRPFTVDRVLYQLVVLRSNYISITIIISPQGIINAATLAAFLFAAIQLHSTGKAIDLLVETTAISSTQEIVEQINNVLSPPYNITEMYLASATIAIGKTGANEKTYAKYVDLVKDLVKKIDNNCHFKYFTICDDARIIHDAEGKTYSGLDENDALLKFYKEKGFSEDVLDEIILNTIELHLEIKSKVNYVGVTRGISPHFILINPDSWDRVAIIWNVDGVSSDDKKVISAGFITRNIETIRVMKGIFDGIS